MEKLTPTYKVSDFDYNLEKGLIAQTPISDRQSSRLMVLNRQTNLIEHRRFYDIIDYLNQGDCLVLNNTRVFPARIYGIKEGGGAKIEFLLIRPRGDNVWEVILKPGKRAKINSVINFNDGLLKAQILKEFDNGNRLVKFFCDGDIYDILDKIGEMPLPHYITKKLEVNDRYQTVYSKVKGSCAAPTAGLHFTPELLLKISKKGISVCSVTLHVGIGTFRPVSVDNILEHDMHFEYFELTKETADIINKTKSQSKRVISVGTTTTRTLESCLDDFGRIYEKSGETNIFIYPPYRFKAVDALVTNFHLPKSTLIMLVSAFAGKDAILNAYKEAIRLRYRFYSFGDAMLIL